MNAYDNVREVLENLEAINNYENGGVDRYITHADGSITQRPATVRELQELNYEDIASLCDLLGMSDIYLGEKWGNN